MVERLKEAIEKARRQRSDANPGAALAATDEKASASSRETGLSTQDLWNRLPIIKVSPSVLARQRIVTRDKTDPAHVPFDVLRTRLLKVCRDNGWSRIGITSPTKSCGKSFVCLNVAYSLARNPSIRTLLIDFDLKNPTIANLLGLRQRDLRPFLAGETGIDQTFERLEPNLALALNTHRVRDSAELIIAERTAALLDKVSAALQPNIILFDLPPMFATDDALGFLGNIDALMLVAGAGLTKGHHIIECERLLTGNTNFLGVVLNKVEGMSIDGFYDEYRADDVTA